MILELEMRFVEATYRAAIKNIDLVDEVINYEG